MSGALLAGIIGACTFAAFALLLERRGDTAAARLAPYVTTQPRRRGTSRLVTALARMLDGTSPGRRLTVALERAGSDARPAHLVAVSAGAAFAGGVLTLGAGRGALAALLVAVGGAALPTAILRIRAVRRARAFDALLPDLLDMLASSLRVGHGLEQSLRSAAADAGEPIAAELQRALGEVRLGGHPAVALAAVGRRVASEDMAYVSLAVEIQQEVGGSLAELLAVVAEAVRERQQFRRRVRAVTGMQRMSAGVLVVLPLLAAAALTVLSPDYMHPLWHTSSGRTLVVVALGMMLVGTLILKRIVAIRG